MKSAPYPLLFALALGFAACQQEEHSCCVKPNTTANRTTTAAAQPVGALTDMSLYNLSSSWSNQNGEDLKLEKLQGKTQLVAMIYTSCGYACPRTVADLKVLENRLSKYSSDELGIVLVTMDPARDTPAVLKDFAASNSLSPDRWTLLTSTPDNIQELAALLNVKYKNDLKGNISHSNIITLLNAQGEIVHQQEGLGTDPAETVKAVEGLRINL
ncbi:SCO family protein [Pontibacter actiniarum]|nr:SCO family protein [Pontibacter actiniarum]